MGYFSERFGFLRIACAAAVGIGLAVLLANCSRQQQSEVAEAGPGPSATTTSASAPATVTATRRPTLSPPRLVVRDPPPTATSLPTATPTTEPTPTDQPTPTAEPTSTVEPTATSLPTATPIPSPTPEPEPDWLAYLNRFRDAIGIPRLSEESPWSRGSNLHSIYMVRSDDISHTEVYGSPWYTEEGYAAGTNGNIAATQWTGADDRWAINYWLTAPFHVVPILDPQLRTVGFGFHQEQSENFNSAGTMNVALGISSEAPDDNIYPLIFPPPGGETWLRSASLYEWPEPLASCPGYQYPVGAPIIIQMGSGSLIPKVYFTEIKAGFRTIEHCVFTEETYTNPVPVSQRSGKNVLAARDAVVLIPRNKLEVGTTYDVTVNIDLKDMSWSFTVVEPPP